MSFGVAGVAQSVSGCLRDGGSGLLFSPQTPSCYCPIFLHEVNGTPLSLPFTSLCIRWRDNQFRRHEGSSLLPRQVFPAYTGTRWLIITVSTRSPHLSPSWARSIHSTPFHSNVQNQFQYYPHIWAKYSQCFLSNLKQKMHVNWIHSDGLSLEILRGWNKAMLKNFWLDSALKSLARFDEINSVIRRQVVGQACG